MEEEQARYMEQAEEKGLSDDERGRLQCVVDIFSRLAIACKSRTLYSADHPAAQDAVLLLHAVMQDSLMSVPNLDVKVGKESLVYDKWLVGKRMESLRQLASRIRSLNIQEISINAGVSFQEVQSLVELLVSDPEDLVSAGGAETYLLIKGVHGISVLESTSQKVDEDEAESLAGEGMELAPEEVEEPEVEAPQEVADLLELVLNPEELGQVLMGLRGEDGQPLDENERADAIFTFIKEAAAIIEREYPQRKQDCCRGMAESLLFLDSDVRNMLLLRSMFSKIREEPVCSEILNQFNSQEMADLLSHFFPIAPELLPKSANLLKAIGFRESEIRHTHRLLRARLIDLGQVDPSLLEALEVGREPATHTEIAPDKLPTLQDIVSVLGEYWPEEIDEINRISEFEPGVALLSETTPMLLDMIKQGGKLDNPGVAVELLQQNFWGLTTSAQLNMAAMVLENMRDILQNGHPAIDPFRSDLTHMLEEAASEPVMQRTIQLACGRRDDPEALEGLKRYMAVLGPRGIEAMVQALGNEEDMAVRKFIIDVLAPLCKDNIPLLASYLEDERWYLVRNLVTIMARLHSQEALPYLRRTFFHPNPKVRAETIRALGLIGGYGAGEMLMMGLQDDDENVRVLCIRWLGRLEETRAVTRLVKMLEDKEAGAEDLQVKKEIILSLGEIRAPETFDVLRKYQSKQKRFSRAEWQEINQCAGDALQCLVEKFPHLERRR
jgi:HEAT repeat protein